jgi:HK97 family phage major capsid protein
MEKLFELKKERVSLSAEARKLADTLKAENRDLSPEERTRLDEIGTKIEGMSQQIGSLERMQTLIQYETDATTPTGRRSLPLDANKDLPDLDNPRNRYSLLRAMNRMVEAREGKAQFDGIEAEVSREIEIRSGEKAKGFFVPWNLATHRDMIPRNGETRANLTTSTGAGGIANILGTELIELLRNKMLVQAMGARVMTGMTGGTFSLPKQTGTTTAYWVAEGTAPTASALTLAQVTWTPKTVGAFTDITRKFMLQTSLDAEILAREDLMLTLAVELDRVALNGSGSGQEPLGILQNSGVPTTALATVGGPITYAAVIALESAVAAANADFGKLNYVTSAKGRGQLKVTPLIGTTFPSFIWERGSAGPVGTVNNYGAYATNQIPVNLTKSTGHDLTAMIFGNWDSATYAFWSGLDVLVDPYTGSSSGTVRIVVLQDCDFQLRYTTSFAKITDMNTDLS